MYNMTSVEKASHEHSVQQTIWSFYLASHEGIGGSTQLRPMNTFCFAFFLAQTSTWAMPPLNRKQPLAKRAAISQPVKTGHILFCVGLTLSSPKLCSPLVTSQAWWNLYWCCLKGLELIHCFFLTAQFWIGPCCHSTGCPAGAELSCQYYPHCSF